ncbi:MAG: MFS transporter [Polyangia bacterium]
MSRLFRTVHVRPSELRSLLLSCAALFFLFTGYASLRPLRDSLGVTAGVKQLGSLFGWTFVGMLVAMPLFGWLASRLPRRVFLPAVYGFFILNLLGFYALYLINQNDISLARLFFVWVSVVNLFIVSLFWSLQADLHTVEQGSRLFGSIAAGSSLGSIAGPALTALLVRRIGHQNLLLCAAGLWIVALLLILKLLQDRRAQSEDAADGERPAAERGGGQAAERPLGGNPFSGLISTVHSPYLLGIGVFIVLLSATTTFLYMQQAALLARAIAEPTARTRLLATVDTVVNAISLGLQLLVVGRLSVRYGLSLVLLSVPLLMVAGFSTLAGVPSLPVLLFVMVVRRAGEYGLLRPGREVLFTSVERSVKYKAKSFIDTVVYRGADWLNARLHDVLVTLGLSTSGIALAGALVSLAWAAVGFALGRQHARQRVRMDNDQDKDRDREAGSGS